MAAATAALPTVTLLGAAATGNILAAASVMAFGGGVGAMLRAMTKNHRTLDNAMMMSSVMPSEKHSCSGSPLMFWNGNIAIDGLSRNGSGAFGGAFSAIGMR